MQADVDLAAGRVSGPVARQAWDRTRAAGPPQVNRFATAFSAGLPLVGGCDGAVRAAPPDLAAATRACAVRAQRAEAAVRAARVAMRGWADHLARMDARDAGTLSRERARQLWREQVRTAPRDVAAYRAARADLLASPACPLPR